MATDSSQAGIAVIALLYHPTKYDNEVEKQRLEGCFSAIQADRVLSKMIYLLPMDSVQNRNWAKYNRSGLRVTMEHLPCFVIKLSKSSPKVYSLGDAHVVYNIAHYYHEKFLVLTNQAGSSNPDQSAPPVTKIILPNSDQTAPPVTQTSQGPIMITVPHVQTNDVLDNIIAARAQSSDSLVNSSTIEMSESSSANPPVCYPYAGSPASSVDDSSDSLNYKKEMSGDVLESIVPEKKRKYRRKLIDDIVFETKRDKGDNVEMKRLARDLHTAV